MDWKWHQLPWTFSYNKIFYNFIQTRLYYVVTCGGSIIHTCLEWNVLNFMWIFYYLLHQDLNDLLLFQINLPLEKKDQKQRICQL